MRLVMDHKPYKKKLNLIAENKEYLKLTMIQKIIEFALTNKLAGPQLSPSSELRSAQSGFVAKNQKQMEKKL